jgi:hypothetical protein
MLLLFLTLSTLLALSIAPFISVTSQAMLYVLLVPFLAYNDVSQFSLHGRLFPLAE